MDGDEVCNNQKIEGAPMKVPLRNKSGGAMLNEFA